MVDRQARKKFILGTAVKITAILSINTADTAVITIKDPILTTKVNSASMAKDGNKVYSYPYQSISSDVEGVYIITVSITSGSYTAVIQDYFELIKQDGT